MESKVTEGWNLVEFGGIWWNLVESTNFGGIDWMVESGGIFDWMVESGGIDWMVESCGTWWNLQILVESTEWWNLVEYLTDW